MFVVVRSIFWLTAAYLVIKPGVDLPDGGAMAAQAMAAGQQVVAEQVGAIECTSFECIGGKAVATAILRPSPTAPFNIEHLPASNPVPLPRPRPGNAI